MTTEAEKHNILSAKDLTADDRKQPFLVNIKNHRKIKASFASALKVASQSTRGNAEPSTEQDPNRK